METLGWPFFEDRHRALAAELHAWAERELPAQHGDVDAACRDVVRRLGDAGWLGHAVPPLDVRTLCLVRETLARVDALAEFAFAMQALGSGPISLYGTAAQRERWLPRVARGEAIAAFAISEADAGSDVAAMRTVARPDGDAWIIDGEKTWISNAGIADQYVVFCRVADAERAYVALLVTPDDAGFSVTARIDTIAPHPLGTVRFDGCRVDADRVVGEPRKGLRVALGTLDVFRTTVGAAALGLARRALDEALAFAAARRIFGKALAEHQLTQARLARMATEIDASALLVYRAAWTKDGGAARVTREAAMAKMYATEAAQRVIDDAVQLLGGRGVTSGHPVERLYREIRSLRIYEGTTEVQQLVIAQQILEAHANPIER
ncbi:acyl-CoA dehydrogenase domain-containing protein (plasmid) [Gemmatirosa kalamazoonensis]|uniref:Acyl-CoA dehydrogenase domain-containing protein n=1 Tax=Gemmatirosa kalamazoonensis TaxID=861299 RepID=W0RQ38_9BACT|nr:acyl-CoA dehydrogenase family protein [Gemmatirosa kalamazoonensis]AHG93114.1 acyl-CoA dehydrogenase domain-containing protein [Gemmatirosa kalamazoonensis]